ncbi:ORF6N domain-containing protein [Liquorilactobacillus nagelii]|jgi:DNA-binding protein|uniref:ORF6N domain-containing protein n=1 Tax=Liquorilactobacillus nagelii TaxID=82688 RepID=UPI0024331178|nr:ORF6N domain-containing protein [Liquorilactobacillus nagelii]MCI1700031.1 ORF6N domain-containing protein [Liquorilactobacillus nagelii]
MDLKIIGKLHIGKYEFTGIEGGFGKNKKSMLVKDIAKIHGREIKAVNQAINMNRKRFRKDIDIIDLKHESGSIKLTEFFTKQQIANFNNIYLLSERGYAKLLKILEDDKAWEIYDQLVDNYFNMRQAIKTNQPALLKGKRLSIMETNAATRRAKLVYDIALKMPEGIEQQRLLAKAASMITGEATIPVMKKAEYSAQQVAENIGHGLTANMVGRIANKLNLKAEQPGQNKYGRWANSKSKYSSKETPQWFYFDKGLKAIKEYKLQEV